METNEVIIGYQYFTEDIPNQAKAFELFTLAHLYSENLGPVVMVCTEHGYDYLVNHFLDDIYIDVIICPDSDSLGQIVNNIATGSFSEPVCLINTLQDSPENLRILYSENNIDAEVSSRIRIAIEKENLKNKI